MVFLLMSLYWASVDTSKTCNDLLSKNCDRENFAFYCIAKVRYLGKIEDEVRV